MKNQNTFTRLAAPFNPSDLEWRAGATNQDKTQALALAYITSRAVMDRLDEVIGPENWCDEYQPGPDGGLICGLSLRVNGEWVTNLMLYANVGISLFIGWSLLSRLAGMSFSLEGKQYWLLKSAPVSTMRLVAGKYLVAYLPTLVLCRTFLLITSLLQWLSLDTLAYSLVVVALSVAGITGLNLALGILGANFEWEDPRRISQGAMGCLGFLVSGFCLLVCLLFFFGTPILFDFLDFPSVVGRLIGIVLGTITSLGLMIIPLRFVRQRIPHLAE